MVGVYNAMRMAVGVMESIGAILSAFFSQVLSLSLGGVGIVVNK